MSTPPSTPPDREPPADTSRTTLAHYDASADAFGPNLMDISRRAAVVEAGLAQGRREAERLRNFWN